MTLSKRFSRVLCVFFAFAILFALSQPVAQTISAENSAVATSTYYDYK